MNQSKLFATGLNEPDTTPVVPTESQKAAQKRAILENLRWAGELGVTALRMREICPSSLTQRISDLRKEGYEIECLKSEAGYNTYFLREKHETPTHQATAKASRLPTRSCS